MKILIVEDQWVKANNIKSFLEKEYDGIVVDIACSYQSGLEKSFGGGYDMLLLDMTLPNYDIKEGEDGGLTRMKGGQLIVEELIEEDIPFMCAVVTQYETFDNESIDTVDNQMRMLCGNKYFGYVKYNNSDDNWKQNLKQIFDDAFNTNN